MPRSKPVRPSDLKTTRKGKVKRRSLFWRFRRVLFIVVLVGTVGLGGFGWVVSKVELPEALPASQTSFICAADVSAPGSCNVNNALAKLSGEQDRVEVALEQVPADLQNAVLAMEDRDFFEHDGIDPLGIARAAWNDIRGGGRQGGSTITQQYVKNVYLTQERTLNRKLKEAVMSVKLEQKMSKSKILESYLNTIYFGRGAYGVQAASRVYFGRDVQDLTLDQSAYLAGVIRNPASADFQTAPEEAERRRALVLAAMAQEAYITPEQRDFASAIPMDPPQGYRPFAPRKQVDVLRNDVPGGEYFVEYVRRFLVERYGENVVYGGGLRVYTTIDPRQQQAAYDAVVSTLNQPGDPAGALVAVDEQGHVRAMMGGRDFSQSQVNLAVGREGGGSGRQPGSTFKAFALAEAVREGYSVEAAFRAPDELTFPKADNGEDWVVEGGCCGGGVTTLVQATQDSVNTVFAQLMIELGAAPVIDMAKRMGITSPLPEVPSVVLGSGEVSVLDMASAYSTFSNDGAHLSPIIITRVEDASGRVIENFTPQRTEVLTENENAKVVYALQQVTLYGTGKAAQIDKTIAGKTGTTDDNRDAWFVGFTPHVTAAVWMGYPGTEGQAVRPMEQVHGEDVEGGNLPAEIWRKFMLEATQDHPDDEFTAPGNLSEGKEFHPELIVPSTVVNVPPPTAPPTTQYQPQQVSSPATGSSDRSTAGPSPG